MTLENGLGKLIIKEDFISSIEKSLGKNHAQKFFELLKKGLEFRNNGTSYIMRIEEVGSIRTRYSCEKDPITITKKVYKLCQEDIF